MQKVPRVLSEGDASTLVETPRAEDLEREPVLAALRDRALLELLYATGLRASELVGLDADRLLLADRVVRVVGKGRKERIVPFGEPAARTLKAYLDARPGAFRPGEPVFVHLRGGRLRTARC